MIRMVDPKLLRMRSAWSPWKDGIDGDDKPPGAEYRARGSVGIVRVRGVVGEEVFDDCHPDDLIAAIDRAATDDATTVAVLELDSPGGSVARFGDIGAALDRLAASKPLHAVAHDKMASLAYWMATYATSIVATSSAVVGSIGVVMDVEDTSAMLGAMGVKVIPVTDAPAKLAGMPGVVQGEDQVEAVRAMVLPMGRRFREAVSRARAMAPEAVAALQGRAMFGPEAMEVGLVDRVVVFEEWIGQLAGAQAAGGANETGRGARVAAQAAGKAGASRAPAKAKARAAGVARGAPTGARAMTEKELIDKYPDRKDEIKGRMAQEARKMDEEMSAEDEQIDEPVEGADAEDGQVDEEASAKAQGDGDDAEANANAKAESGQDGERKPAGGEAAAQGSGQSGQAGRAAAAATLAELKALGCDSDFIVLAMEQGYTAAQARGTWAAMGRARAQAGKPSAGGVPAVSAGRQTPPPSDGAAGVGPRDLEQHAFAEEARAMAKSRGMTIVQAELQLKKDKPELYADYEALEKQRAQAIHERRLKMVV